MGGEQLLDFYPERFIAPASVCYEDGAMLRILLRRSVEDLPQLTELGNRQIGRRSICRLIVRHQAIDLISCNTLVMAGERTNPETVTRLLANWREGDPSAAEKLIDSVYKELRQLAGYYMRDEREDHTLQPTALVHEMFLRLSQSEPISWQNRAHFFAVAAQQLRRILVNHARDRQADKRGGKRVKLTLSYLNGLSQAREQDVLELNEALDRLENFEPRAARVIELRFFAGLTEAEAAEALGISVATLKRDWAFGRAWLLRQLGS